MTASRCRGSATRAARCNYCVSGWETLCHAQKMMGYTIDGGFGEYATAYARYVVKVPEGIDPFDAAPLTCAGVTTYKAVKVAGTRSSDFVAVFGVGGLGHLAIQYAAIAGGRVDRGRRDRREARARARARRRVHHQRHEGGPGRGDPAARRRRPGDRARRLARVRSSRPTGRSVVAASSCSSRCRPTTRSRSRSSRPCSTGSRSSARSSARAKTYARCSSCTRAGKTRVIRETRPLDQVNEAIADVEAGRVAARIVLEP